MLKATPDMDEEEIKDGLIQRNVPVQSVTKLREKTQRQSHSYLVTIAKKQM